jgi:hypothetical protein
MKSTAGRRGIGLAAAGVLAVSGGFATGTASAATTIAAPTVSSPFLWYTNTPYTFTFTEPAGSTAVSFAYSINGAALVSVPAVNDSAQVNLEFTGSYDTLDVYAVAADGTMSAATTQIEQPVDDNVWAADDDVNGDGLPDLLTAGGAGTGLASGIWQALGTGGGHLQTPATNLVDAGTNEPASYFRRRAAHPRPLRPVGLRGHPGLRSEQGPGPDVPRQRQRLRAEQPGEHRGGSVELVRRPDHRRRAVAGHQRL